MSTRSGRPNGYTLYMYLTVSESRSSCSCRRPALIHDAADLLVHSRGRTPILLLLSRASEVWMRQMSLVIDVRGQEGVAPMAVVLLLQLGLKSRIHLNLTHLYLSKQRCCNIWIGLSSVACNKSQLTTDGSRNS